MPIVSGFCSFPQLCEHPIGFCALEPSRGCTKLWSCSFCRGPAFQRIARGGVGEGSCAPKSVKSRSVQVLIDETKALVVGCGHEE
jgi:hypothetical protein